VKLVERIIDAFVFLVMLIDAAVTEIRAKLGLIRCDILFMDCMWYLGNEEVCSRYIAESRCRE